MSTSITENVENFVLILTVENEDSINNRNTDLPFRFFEKESINCIKIWREKAGWLKDIQIFVVNPTGSVNKLTKTEYNKYKVNYIEHKPKEFKEFTHGFFNVHYVGKFLEDLEVLQNKILIHIDLDMEILREIPKDFFKDLEHFDCFMGVYSHCDEDIQRKKLYSKVLTNTDFIVSKSSSKVYTKILSCIDEVNETYDEFVKKGYREYDREEYSSDLFFSKFNVKPIFDYEQGEGYNNKAETPYFWHEHIYEKPNVKLQLRKFKLIKELNARF